MSSSDSPPLPAAPVAVVIVPFIAHGHLTQLLRLSHLISSHNIPVHFITSAPLLSSRHPTTTTTTHLHQLPLPPFTSPPPHPSSPFPTHLQPLFDSTLHLRHPTAALIRSLSLTFRRVAVVHDVLMSYVVQDVGSIPQAETYLFQPPPAFYKAAGHWERTGRSGSFPVDPGLMSLIPSSDEISSPEFRNFLAVQLSHMSSYVGELFDSSRVIEGGFIEYLEKERINGVSKIWAVGPLNPVHLVNPVQPVNPDDPSGSEKRHRCLRWLDKQPRNSVLYVAFGTTTTFSGDQIRELALGLEKSGERFVWVVRAADTGDGFESGSGGSGELPEGFEERVKGRGLVERGWAPQLEILGHFGTGGFMSHCGWNSCMESISMGVPLATWPMHSDQPRNAFLITSVLRVGVAARDWERRKELVRRDVVAEVVKTLMASEEGEELRRRAAELGGEVRESVADGGVSRREMDDFISYICRPL